MELFRIRLLPLPSVHHQHHHLLPPAHPYPAWSPELEKALFSAIVGSFFSAIFTFFFALAGTFLGAMTGALIGQETESGFIRGSAVGAISGAVFSIEVFEASRVLWQSDESGIGCLLYLIDVIASLLSGRLVRERIGPAMLSAVQSQVPILIDRHSVNHIFSFGVCVDTKNNKKKAQPKN